MDLILLLDFIWWIYCLLLGKDDDQVGHTEELEDVIREKNYKEEEEKQLISNEFPESIRASAPALDTDIANGT